jgi:hypothetical protein
MLKAWKFITQGTNAMMAIAEKRSLGTSCVWLGVRFLAQLGLSALTAQKVLSCVAQISDALSGDCCFDAYRRLMGFLEHVRQVLFLLGDKMYGLYECFKDRPDPAVKIKLSVLATKQLRAWRKRVLSCPGARVTVRREVSVAPSVGLRNLHTFSDAAKEGTQCPGLGGWLCGFWWSYPLSLLELTLHITALEAIAAVVNLVWAAQLLCGGLDNCADLPEHQLLTLHVDAQATAHVLVKGKARSPMMQFIHSWALGLPGFSEFLAQVDIHHIFGVSNLASDAASRGLKHVLLALGKHLRLKLVHRPAPEVARSLLRDAVAFSRSLPPVQKKQKK